MSWFNSVFGSNAWETGEVPLPWAKDRLSIHGFIEAHLNPDGYGLTAEAQTLPDEEILFAGQKIRWVGGATDSLFGDEVEGEDGAARVDAVFAAVQKALNKPDWHRMQTLYDLLLAYDLLSYIEPLLQRIAAAGRSLNIERLWKLAHLFATEAPDRGPVKFGMALCGVIGGEGDRLLFLKLGMHDELTLYAVLGLIHRAERHGEPYPEREIWRLARQVEGWGRIQAVERLAKTRDPEIRSWLLRGGYRNAIMYDYLAMTAATTGGLVEALRAQDPDAELIDCAGEIIFTLLDENGPGPGIDAYTDGVEVVSLYLGHLKRRPGPLSAIAAVSAILTFLRGEDKDGEIDWVAHGWTDDRRRALEAEAEAVLDQPHWQDAVLAQLDSKDDAAFQKAKWPARLLGIDVWERSFERQRRGLGEEWFELAMTDDPDRIERAIALANEMLPVDEIATGPTAEMGFGKSFPDHVALEMVVSGLWRFPGRGWNLVRALLASPLVRNRDDAVKTLLQWPRESWPVDADETLRQAAAREPNTETREQMEAVLDGRAQAEADEMLAEMEREMLEKMLDDPNSMIKGCTDEIRSGQYSGKDLALSYANRGLACIELGEHRRAIEDFDEALRLDQDNAVIYAARGRAYFGLGEHRRAIEDLDDALRREPGNANFLLERGGVYYRLNDYNRAIEDYDQALHREPEYSLAYTHRGIAYDNLGEHARAIEDFNQSLRRDPDDAYAHTNRGIAYRKLGEYHRAIEDYDQSLRFDPEDADTYNARAWVLYLMGRNDEALGDIDHSLSLRPGDASFFDTRAHVLAALGRHREALTTFEQAIQAGGETFLRRYQQSLKKFGYYGGTVDGLYGPQVRAALVACIEAGCQLQD